MKKEENKEENKIKEQNNKMIQQECENEIKSLKRAMKTIDTIASINNTEDEKDGPLLDIYKIAHAFSGTCGNPHEDWRYFEAIMAEKLKNY